MDKNGKTIKVGVCMPTTREDQIVNFLDKWIPIWKESHYQINIYVHADKPNKIFNEGRYYNEMPIKHTCHKDIELELKDDAWIIPQNSGACRSFPMLLAYKDGCDFIITLDDDCLPTTTTVDNFINSHIEAFSRNRWYSTIECANSPPKFRTRQQNNS